MSLAQWNALKADSCQLCTYPYCFGSREVNMGPSVCYSDVVLAWDICISIFFAHALSAERAALFKQNTFWWSRRIWPGETDPSEYEGMKVPLLYFTFCLFYIGNVFFFLYILFYAVHCHQKHVKEAPTDISYNHLQVMFVIVGHSTVG